MNRHFMLVELLLNASTPLFGSDDIAISAVAFARENYGFSPVSPGKIIPDQKKAGSANKYHSTDKFINSNYSLLMSV
jgi:hypothetical protein